VGLGALATGVGLGGAAVALVLILIRLLQRMEVGRYGESVSAIDPTWALLAAIVVGALFGWRRSTPLESPWQRGVISTLSVFGALFLAILAAPIWHFLQFPGLILLFLACLALGVSGSRWSVSGAGP
jgi:MYXO-CTERM domain-containing protein